VSGRPVRASALSSESDTLLCDHCSETGAAINKAAPPIIPSVRSCFMIGLHDHHRAHSTRVARTVEKPSPAFSPGHYCGTNTPSIEIVQLFPPSVSRVMGRAAPHKRGWSRLANATNEIARLPAPPTPRWASWGMNAITRTPPGRKTAPQQRGGRGKPQRHLVHDAQCELPVCGEMHAVSVGETYIDDAIRKVSEIARRV
jgi:hypothetical protein